MSRPEVLHTGRSVLLYAHPSMDELARAVIASCDRSTVTRQRISSVNEPDVTVDRTTSDQLLVRRNVRYVSSGIKWSKFADGFPNLFLDGVKSLAGRDVLFLASFHSPEVIFEQLSVIYAIPRYLARSFTLILPYFPTGTMERVDTEGQIATAKTLAQLLSSIPLTARGPAQVVVFDIHALQERFYFGDSVIPRLESAIPLLVDEISELSNQHKIAVVFPDDGAHKRFHTMFDDQPLSVVVCSKVREPTGRIVKIKEGEVKGCHAIIVDDLVQTGGTLIECAKVLMTNGATHVSAYVTHAVFPNNSWQKFTLTSSPQVKFEKFWITDSLPHASQISQHPPFKLLSLGRVIADALLSYDLQQN